jgi:hypothetical protein
MKKLITFFFLILSILGLSQNSTSTEYKIQESLNFFLKARSSKCLNDESLDYGKVYKTSNGDRSYIKGPSHSLPGNEKRIYSDFTFEVVSPETGRVLRKGTWTCSQLSQNSNQNITTNNNDDMLSTILSLYQKQALSNKSASKGSSGNLDIDIGDKKSSNGSNSSYSKPKLSSTSSKHTFQVTITWNNPNCGSCPFPRPSAQNGSIDYFYERSGSYTVKPKCPICGKTQYNTIAGFTDNIGTSNQGSKVVTISCN